MMTNLSPALQILFAAGYVPDGTTIGSGRDKFHLSSDKTRRASIGDGTVNFYRVKDERAMQFRSVPAGNLDRIREIVGELKIEN